MISFIKSREADEYYANRLGIISFVRGDFDLIDFAGKARKERKSTKIETTRQSSMPPHYLFHMSNLGNTALTLQAELNHTLFRQYELELDNEVLRQLNAELKTKLKDNL